MLTHAPAQYSVSEFAADARLGLTKEGQKEILSKYLYDEIGSELFEVITLLARVWAVPRRSTFAAGKCRRHRPKLDARARGGR